MGSGYIAMNHLAALRQMKDAELVAVVARNAETGGKLAREYGCALFTSMQEAKDATGMDAVIICTPTHTHEEFVVEAAKLKCHVLCEKPITFTTASFDRMTAACRENGVRFMVAQVSRWWPEFITIRRYLDENRLGPIHMIYEKRLSQHPTWANWHRDPSKSGGGIYDLNIHDLDFLYSVFGRPETVYANGWKSPTGCWNHVCTSLVWKSGVRATVETSLEMTGNWPFSIGFRATGDKGTLTYDYTSGVNINDGEQGGSMKWYPAKEARIESIQVSSPDMFEGEIGEFIRGIEENREFSVADDEVRGVLEIVEASLRSLNENVLIHL